MPPPPQAPLTYEALAEQAIAYIERLRERITELDEERERILDERKGFRQGFWRLIDKLVALQGEGKVSEEVIAAVNLQCLLTFRYNNEEYDEDVNTR